MSILKKASYIGTSLVTLLAMGTYFAPAAQAAQYNMSKKNLYFNGNLVSSPEGFAAQDSASQDSTTYIPIWYIQQLLKSSFDITQTWDGHNWHLAIPDTLTLGSFTEVSPSNDDAKRVVWLNNKAFESPTAITATDPATGELTTYFPLWYIQQVLHLLGFQDSWDGTNWRLTADTQKNTSTGSSGGNDTTVTGGSSGSSSNSGSGNTSAGGEFTYGLLHNPLQNAATDDTSWWSRANSKYYISAQTADPNIYSDPVSGSKILNIEPGQKLYLFAYSDTLNVNKDATTWSVNSPDGTITPDSNDWTLANLKSAVAAFVATKPGVYTVQAKIDGSYSIPLVITVGLDQLKGHTILQSSDAVGIRPLPSGLTVEDTEDDGAGTTFSVYSLDGNWVPVSGKTTTGVKFVSILFGDSEVHPTWSYSIPVNADGTFAAEVKSPTPGQTDMYVYANYAGDLTSYADGGSGIDNAVGVTMPMPSNAITIPQSELDLMPTAKMDYNLTPSLNQIASIIYENATSMKSGMEAINNYVSDLLTYDNSELQTNHYRFQDLTTTLNSRTGICEDYAEMETSMLKSIGIRAETVSGTTPSSTKGDDPTTQVTTDDHEWLQAWDGTEWIVADPTWSSSDESNTAIVTDEFFTNTSSFQSSHVTDASSIGDTFSKVHLK